MRADWEASARSLKPKPRLTEITVPRSRSVPKHKEGEGPGREAGMDSLVGRGGGEPTAPAASVDAPIEVGNGAEEEKRWWWGGQRSE